MPKSVDGLMRYLRDKKGISISGSTQKRKLRNVGYYHGYKGFRFIGKSTNAIPYTDFKELMAIYEFDMQLKSLLYPQLMFIETALKNYVLEEIFARSKVDGALSACLEIQTGIRNITFKSITDYIILVAYLLKRFGVPKGEIKRFISKFQDAIETLRKQVPINVFAKIVLTDTRNKLQGLQKFI